MKKVTDKEFYKDLNTFIQKHGKKSDWKVITSPYVNGQYHKEYVFENGAVFTDVNYLEGEYYEVEIKELGFSSKIPVIKHEYWSTDDATSKFWYEKR